MVRSGLTRPPSTSPWWEPCPVKTHIMGLRIIHRPPWHYPSSDTAISERPTWRCRRTLPFTRTSHIHSSRTHSTRPRSPTSHKGCACPTVANPWTPPRLSTCSLIRPDLPPGLFISNRHDRLLSMQNCRCPFSKIYKFATSPLTQTHRCAIYIIMAIVLRAWRIPEHIRSWLIVRIRVSRSPIIHPVATELMARLWGPLWSSHNPSLLVYLDRLIQRRSHGHPARPF